jgi:hypothetical protein
VFQKGVFYFGIKVFNHLPSSIKNMSNEEKEFKIASVRFLLMNSFYTLDEYFNWKLPKVLVPCKCILELNFIKICNLIY